MNKTLYGKSKNGKIKTWNISVDKVGESHSVLRIKHGFIDGKKQLDERDITTGKNIGKKNETTPYEQAILEATSLVLKKKDDNYAESISLIPSNSDGMFLPMLAHSYDKHSKKINYPCWVQPKLDGARMLAKKQNGSIILWSRKGKEIVTLSKIKKELNSILEEGQCLDGEVYYHGWGFQRIISAVKKERDDTDILEYHVYDSPHLTDKFEDRFVNSGLEGKINKTTRIKWVKTSEALNSDELTLLEGSCIGENYEGLMARNKSSLYKFKHRSYDLQKVKRFEDEEFEIIGGKEGSGRESGLVIFKCLSEDGKPFDVRPKGDRKLRSDMFLNLNSYIGKKLTVKFQGRTSDSIPRFPVGIKVRPDWDME